MLKNFREKLHAYQPNRAVYVAAFIMGCALALQL